MLRSPFYHMAFAAVLIFAAAAGVRSMPGASGGGGTAVVDSTDDPTYDTVHDSAAVEASTDPAKGRRRNRTDVYGAEDMDFSVRCNGHVIPYSIFGVYAMPGEEIDLQAVLPRTSGTYELETSAGTVSTVGAAEWRWTAPERTGVYTIEIKDVMTQSTVTLNTFVLTPFTPDNRELNGYRIGRYEDVPLDGNSVYRPPAGFVELRPDNRDVRVSPHFTLGQFVAKQKSSYPKYLLLREPLLLKLEMLLSEVKKMGVPASSLHVMSGYRTPHYNRAIGNTTNYSRHLYGGAADIFVDVDQDAYMDDVNGDGQVDIEDAQALAGIVEANADEDWYDSFTGGLGVYAKNSVRGPFIHVDVRGNRARW